MRRRSVPAVLVIALAAGGGCKRGLTDIDQKIDRVIEARSETLRTNRVPDVRRDTPDPGGRDKRTARSLDTSNPPADELSYDPADESRDIREKLLGYGDAGEPRPISLREAWRLTQISAREFLNAEEDYVLSAIRLLIERHRWSPRLFNDTSVTLSGDGDDGRFETAVRVLNELRVTQRLPHGGDIAARWLVDATEQLRSQATGRYRQSSLLALDANIPLLRGAGEVARESLIQQERNLVYAARTFERFRRSLLVDIASDYFTLQNTKARIANQERQLTSLRANQARAEELVEAGRLSAFRARIFENNVLLGENNLESLKESYRLQLDRFKVRLGLPVDQAIDVDADVVAIPEPNATTEAVTDAALAYRLDLQNQRDQLDDSRRAVDNARNQTLADLDVTGSVSLPTDRDLMDAGLQFDPDDLSYSLGVTLGLPLDREIERLQLRESIVNYQRSERAYTRFRDDLIVTVRASLRAVELARFQYEIAEQQVEINRLRLEEQELRRDEVDPQTLIDAENDLLDSENARDQALTDLRNAVLNYLLATGQLRVAPDGGFEPLPGMPGG